MKHRIPQNDGTKDTDKELKEDNDNNMPCLHSNKENGLISQKDVIELELVKGILDNLYLN